jgi:soluble lytic murein transglycosylase-like protein
VAERPVAWWTVLLVLAGSAPASAVELSPSFLGMYRKTMEVEHALLGYSKRYGVNPCTARAVLIQESGGNGISSRARRARLLPGMPSTSRSRRNEHRSRDQVLGQLERRFGREDYAVAATRAAKPSRKAAAARSRRCST